MSFRQLETLGPVLARIDALQGKVDEAKTSQPDAYDRVMESWAIESTYNSNNIEGSTLSLGDTALLFDGVQVNGPADDIRQAEGGFAALRFLRSAVYGREPLTETLVKRAHELVFAEAKDPATRGVYSTVEVEITGTSFQPTPSVYVPERMAELVAMCTEAKRHPAIVAALFHLEFESIHPFVNANGRTGRLMSNYLLMSAGFEPVNIQAESRARYIAAIRAFQENDDPYPFAMFFCLNLAERLEKVLSLLTTGNTSVAARGHSDIGDFLHESDDPDKNLTIDTQEPDDSRENLTFGIPGTDDSLVRKRLEASGFNASTRSNVLVLYSRLAGGDGFGRKDVIAVLGGSDSRAGDLLKKMLDVGIVAKVSGKGKGRYAFAEK